MMDLDAALERLAAAYHAGRPLALLFDYDGTLVPLADHPAHARLQPETRRLLCRLAGHPAVLVGILSGRPLKELKEMVGLAGPRETEAQESGCHRICYGGVSGMELELEGVPIIHPEADRARALMGRLLAPLREVAAGFPGSWVEDKSFGLTLHYRAVPPSQAAALQTRALDCLHRAQEPVRILDVALALEITAAFGWTKGSAVARMTAHAGAQAFPLFAGDEGNDRDGLETVNALGGISLGIGPRAPAAARYQLADAFALQERMAHLLKLLQPSAPLPALRTTDLSSAALAARNTAPTR